MQFNVGDSVILVKGQDILDYQEMATHGEVGTVINNSGYWVIEDYDASYEYIVSFPSYENLCCYGWQLSPVNKSKKQAIEHEAIAAKGVGVKHKATYQSAQRSSHKYNKVKDLPYGQPREDYVFSKYRLMDWAVRGLTHKGNPLDECDCLVIDVDRY